MIYDDFSIDYDRFVNWQGRLALEMPFLENKLKKAGVKRVLDTACGTGMHAIALAHRGFKMAGADVSQGMIKRARINAEASETDIRFEAAGFGEMQPTFGSQAFEAVICLGNSLPHLLTKESLTAALKDFVACLTPGGLLIIQNRNFDAVMQKRERWMEPQSAQEEQTEWLFLRFYDYDADGLITFHVVTLRRVAGKTWTQNDIVTRLQPILHDEMKSSLETAGFERVDCYGDLTGAPFDAKTSGNLVVVARLAKKRPD
jgi:SAM-dependent methyltransferase